MKCPAICYKASAYSSDKTNWEASMCLRQTQWGTHELIPPSDQEPWRYVVWSQTPQRNISSSCLSRLDKLTQYISTETLTMTSHTPMWSSGVNSFLRQPNDNWPMSGKVQTSWDSSQTVTTIHTTTEQWSSAIYLQTWWSMTLIASISSIYVVK